MYISNYSSNQAFSWLWSHHCCRTQVAFGFFLIDATSITLWKQWWALQEVTHQYLLSFCIICSAVLLLLLLLSSTDFSHLTSWVFLLPADPNTLQHNVLLLCALLQIYAEEYSSRRCVTVWVFPVTNSYSLHTAAIWELCYMKIVAFFKLEIIMMKIWMLQQYHPVFIVQKYK